ncbi:MAG: MaoC/PaaZ C-terminal domain-containing protein, partial [Pseudonocardiaceae bacterium]
MEVRFSKTVSEGDVYAFAGISGDFSPNHVDHEYMSSTRYGQRIAH